MLATLLDCMLHALTAHLFTQKPLSIFNILRGEQATFLGAGFGEACLLCMLFFTEFNLPKPDFLFTVLTG